MTPDQLKAALEGCYVTVPTPFDNDAAMGVNESVLRRYVRFLVDSGLTAK